MSFDLKNFISNPRIFYQKIDAWEHYNRAVCWINDFTITVTYDPKLEEDASLDNPQEIHFYTLSDNKFTQTGKIEIPHLEILNTQMYFDRSLNALVLISDNIGVVVVSLDGTIIFKQQDVFSEYNSKARMFIQNNITSVCIYSFKDHVH